jgi:hypothetical protein
MNGTVVPFARIAGMAARRPERNFPVPLTQRKTSCLLTGSVDAQLLTGFAGSVVSR